MPSGVLLGHTHARIVEHVNAADAAIKRMKAGRVDQNQSDPPLAENKVKKSETETFR